MKLLTQKNVADFFGVSQATISRMASNGDLPHIVLRSGKRKRVIRFRAEEVEQWLSQRSRGGASGLGARRKARAGCNNAATGKTAGAQLHEVEAENGKEHGTPCPVPGA
jgi:excisionase family DNA binding protein